MAGFPSMADGEILVVATIGLPGLPLGREALIDPTDPYMADCLARGYLQEVPTTGSEDAREEPEVEAEPEPEAAPPPDPTPESAEPPAA